MPDTGQKNRLTLLRRHADPNKFRIFINDDELQQHLDVSLAEQIRLCYQNKENIEVSGIEIIWDKFELVVKNESDSSMGRQNGANLNMPLTQANGSAAMSIGGGAGNTQVQQLL